MLKKMNITFETLLTLLAIVVGFGVAYGSLTTRVKDLEQGASATQEMAIDIAVMKETLKNIEKKLQ